MILVSAQNLGRQYSGDPIFEGLSFEARAGDRIGLVGPNGAGKTTLLRVLAGLDKPDYGSLFTRPGIRVSLLRQEPDFGEHETLIDVARSGVASLLELQHELEEAAQEIAEAEDDDDRQRATRRYEQIRDQMEHHDAFAVDHRVEEILQGLGFSSADFSRAASTFSGGQQSRLMLAKLLLESPDLMLLDEPSNHLDIQTTEWLESYLSRQPVAMVVVSHDRQFLDAVVTKVWELHFGDIAVYPGNYTQYWRLRQEKAKVLERQSEKQQAEVADLKHYIAKYAAGQRAKQAKDREKKLARVEQVETMRDVETPVMGFGEVDRAGDVVIEARNLSKGYDRTLFGEFSLSVLRGQCVGVIGPNGAGKTTLLKILIGRERPDAGEVKLGHRVSIGYYDQGLDSLPDSTPILRAIWPESELDWVEQDSRNLLARFGLKGELAFHTVGQLSGGEKGKAALARLAATCANVLVMDEPTNHLDIWSCDALERSIREFEGTVLVVSHDRYFLNQVADRIIEVNAGRARVIEGDYETYRSIVAQETEAANKPTAPKVELKPLSESQKKRRRRFPYRKPNDIEREIAEIEAQLAQTETALADPANFRDARKSREVQARYDSLIDRRAQLYEHWEEALELNS
jgi:ATP-binding cassette subfamily F protein 3